MAPSLRAILPSRPYPRGQKCMVGFVLHVGHRTTMLLLPGMEPGHPDVDTLYEAHQHPLRAPPTHNNQLGELCHLHLDGSLDDYIDKFYQRLTRCDELSKPQ
jgi:hypothetical protein